jgi:hypothetical protein
LKLRLSNNIYYFLFFVLGSLFFIDDINKGYTILSTDLYNIIPIAIKFDNPEYFGNDLFLKNSESLKYYSPLFIKIIQFGEILTGDYLKGIKLIHFFLNVFYSITWFLFFKKIVRPSVLAFMFTILCRGILWAPGKELWGIAGVWTFIPRTVFLSFVPVLLLILTKKNIKYNFLIVSGISGILMNIHPVSAVIVFPSLIMWYFIFLDKENLSFKNLILSVTVFLFFSIPFIYYYIISSDNSIVNADFFKSAMNYRVGSFTDPFPFLRKLLRIEWVILIFFPHAYVFFLKPNHRKDDFLLWVYLSASIVFFILLVFLIENFFYMTFNINLNVFYQLIRNVKYLLIVSFAIYAMIINDICKLYIKSFSNFFFGSVIMLFFCTIFFSKSIIFDRIPFFGDDIIRSILPDKFSFGTYLNDNQINANKDLEGMLLYINQNINNDLSIIGPPVIRAATLNSVPYDLKGAAMLIHGQKNKFIEWSKLYEKFKVNSIDTDLLTKLKVDYLLSSKIYNNVNHLRLIENSCSYYLYKIIK